MNEENAQASEVIKIDDSNFSVKEEVVTVYSVEEIKGKIKNLEARIAIIDENYAKNRAVLVDELAIQQSLLQKGIDVGVKDEK